jgi:hypothetical protein
MFGISWPTTYIPIPADNNHKDKNDEDDDDDDDVGRGWLCVEILVQLFAAKALRLR